MKYEDFSYEVKFGLARITGYVGDEEVVTVPTKVDKYNVYQLETGAFTGLEHLKKVILPNTIGKLAERVFIGCSNLEEIELSCMDEFPEENSLVYECPSFKKFVTDSPRLACKIERLDFYRNCSIFCEKDFKIEVIDEEAKEAILNKVRLRSNELIIPDEIDGYKITQLGFSLSSKDNYLLKKIQFPKYLENIPSCFIGFGGTYSTLETVIFNEGLTSIGDFAFDQTPIKNPVIIPSSVKKIGQNAFRCRYWNANTYEIANDSKLETIGVRAFSEAKVSFNHQIIPVGKGSLEGAEISDIVINQSHLPDNALYGTKFGKGVEGFENIKSFGDSSICNLSLVEKYSYVLDLSKMSIPDTKNIRTSIFKTLKVAKDTVLTPQMFYAAGFEEVIFPDDYEGTVIPKDCFHGCSNLKRVVLPKSIDTFEDTAFYGSHIEEMDISNIKFFGECCLYGNHLSSYNLGKNLATLSSQALSRNSEVTEITFDDDCKLEEISDSCFYGCHNLKKVHLSPAIKTLGRGAFANCEELEEINLSNVEILGNQAFSSCEHLMEVDISKVIDIPYSAFYACTNLYSLKTSPNLVNIGNQAFCSCNNLKNFSFNEGLKVIEDYAFSYSGLREVVFPDSLEAIGRDAFRACKIDKFVLGKGIKELHNGVVPTNSVTELDLGSVEIIRPFALESLMKLEKLVIPKTCTTMGKEAISHARYLKEVYIEGTLSSVPLGLFNNCPNVTEIHTDDIKSGRVLVSRKHTSIEKIVPISPDVKIRTRKKKVPVETTE